jgi:hypothetical protein
MVWYGSRVRAVVRVVVRFEGAASRFRGAPNPPRSLYGRSYLVVGLDVQLDLFAGQGADSVGLCQLFCLHGCGGVLCWWYCVLDLHVGECL